MTLLKKKQSKQTTRALQSKNSTGILSYQEESYDEGSNTSLLAARAAALTFSKSNNNNTQSKKQPNQNRPTKRNNSLSDTIPEINVTIVDNTPSSRKLSAHYTSQINLPRRQSKRYSMNDNNSNTEKLTVITKPHVSLKSPPSRPSSLQSSRSPILYPLKSPLMLSKKPLEDHSSSLQVQATTVTAKPLSSQDLIQPLLPVHSYRVYSSSSNSVNSSMESLPLYAKLRSAEGSKYDLRDSFAKTRSYSTGSERSEESLDRSRLYSKSLNYSKELIDPLRLYNHTGEISKDSVSVPEFSITLSENDDDERLSQRSNSGSSMSFVMKSNSRSHSLEQIPSTIEEHIPKEDFSENNVPLIINGSCSSIKPVNLKLRKPPPSSPSLSTSPGDTILQTSTQSLLPSLIRRSSSPRRKPPANYFHGVDDWVDESPPINGSHDEVESLPQYPLEFEELSKKKDHSRHHGIRRATKKMFKKKLKPSNSENYPNSKSLQFKKTMRKEKKDKFNEEKPWKNRSERDFISEQERKRYEGVWVSNKGSYMELVDPTSLSWEETSEAKNAALSASWHLSNNEQIEPQQNLMLNFVVRELWNRSKLPKDTLKQVWDLVDVRKDGTMDKKSFIVGMWLVDQCLYGRKLPKQVDDGVWNSVSSLGLNVVIKNRKR